MFEKSCEIADPVDGGVESFGYIDVGGDQIYFARHHASGSPRAGVVIFGPIGAERERGYRTLVELGRLLARLDFEVLRFDYRGIGESTGQFQDFCLTDWRVDAERCVAHLRWMLADKPIALFGVRAGALLAAECFADDVGDAMLLCAPSAARTLLLNTLRWQLVAEMTANPKAPRLSRDECIARMEAGELVNVDGYFWSERLWRDAAGHTLSFPGPAEIRPWRLFDFRGTAATQVPEWAVAHRVSVDTERFWDASPTLVPRTNELFDYVGAWLGTVFPTGA